MRAILLTALLALAGCATAPAATSSQDIGQRIAAYAQPDAAARRAVAMDQMRDAGLAPVAETFPGEPGKRPDGVNLVARTGPAEGRAILLVAHYDAIVLKDGKLSQAVVDNAASAVAMIEAARRLSSRTRHPVRLLLTDQEELGLRGAHADIAAHGVASIAAVVNADINAYGDTVMFGLNNGEQSAQLVAAMRGLCAESKLSCLEFPNYPPSDDRAYSAAGAPTLSLGRLPESEARDLLAFMSRTTPPASPADIPRILALIHTPEDKMEHVDPAAVLRAADVFEALVMKLDAELP